MTILKKILSYTRTIYHYSLALLGAIIYRFPAKKIKVVAITGTKGKSTTSELINSVLEEAGFPTALANTLRFKIGEDSKRNLLKMTMPGRFFLQKFLRQAVNARTQYAIIEMTSEGARQFRHKFIDLDCLVITNISPEHIESHGSYEKYLDAKLSIARALSKSKKERRILIVNADDKEAEKFLSIPHTEKLTYKLDEAKEISLAGGVANFKIGNMKLKTNLTGIFNVYNLLAAIAFGKSQNISETVIKSALEKIKTIRGRVEKIEMGQNFEVVVDYAHTTDSLEKFYQSFEGKRKICVLGNTGGGRDKWKRPAMARIANQYCETVILTNEDPYDEDPKKIIDEMAVSVGIDKLKIILDRREAISIALRKAKETSLNPLPKESSKSKDKNAIAVLITGKGTDPFIMGPNNTKIPWDDAEIVREELKKILPSATL